MSLIPPESEAWEIATPETKLVWAYSDEKLKDVAERMFENGYSQLPIRERSTNTFMGVISELSIIKKMMNPEMTLEQWKETKICKAGIIDSLLRFPPNSRTLEMALVLLNNPAILLEERLKITGILTRSDLNSYTK